MGKKRKIFLAIFAAVLVLGLAAYFAYPKIKNRFFAKSPGEAGKNSLGGEKTEKSDSAESNSENVINAENGDVAGLDQSGSTDAGNTSVPSGGDTLAHITTEHCDSSCQAFLNDSKLLAYCKQVCGITPVKNVSGCDAKTGIDKDYCLKDLAISKEDSSVCDQISDANVKKACKNRILQDIIEKQTPTDGY